MFRTGRSRGIKRVEEEMEMHDDGINARWSFINAQLADRTKLSSTPYRKLGQFCSTAPDGSELRPLAVRGGTNAGVRNGNDGTRGKSHVWERANKAGETEREKNTRRKREKKRTTRQSHMLISYTEGGIQMSELQYISRVTVTVVVPPPVTGRPARGPRLSAPGTRGGLNPLPVCRICTCLRITFIKHGGSNTKCAIMVRTGALVIQHQGQGYASLAPLPKPLNLTLITDHLSSSDQCGHVTMHVNGNKMGKSVPCWLKNSPAMRRREASRMKTAIFAAEQAGHQTQRDFKTLHPRPDVKRFSPCAGAAESSPDRRPARRRRQVDKSVPAVLASR
ncbi:hypothetical protein Bbelb_006210 [Branchiostoma belcheri]|nr:hypothetical protein Bbelb_006210 [Branchiostoma belcheri]